MKLTPAMRDTLKAAAGNPLRRLHTPGPKPAWPANHTTLYALVRHELLNHDRRRHRKGWELDEWTITDLGREILKPPPPVLVPDRAVFLARPSRGTGDYTYNMNFAIDELEVIDGNFQKRLTESAREREHQRRVENGRDLDTQDATQRLARVRLIARAHHYDFSKEDRLIAHMIRAGRYSNATARLVRLEVRFGERAA